MNDKLNALRRIIKNLKGVVVAFSGGVDSAVLAKVACEELGDQMIAVTGNSASTPSRDIRSSVDFCKEHGIPHQIIKTYEMDNEKYLSNPDNRCFYCKRELFERISDVAKGNGFNSIIEGTNASELKGHRRGFEAAQANKMVVTPYVELGITKSEVREMARALGLGLADRPSTACLSSRFPIGTRIETDILVRLDEAEEYLLGLGIRQVRVRYHGDLARIEVESKDFEICISKKESIAAKIKLLGFRHVTLDLAGYRTGGGM